MRILTENLTDHQTVYLLFLVIRIQDTTKIDNTVPHFIKKLLLSALLLHLNI
jgi:hypothetical protein